jgi:hypothetical protein
MSRFINELKQVSQPSPPPMGFRAAPPAPKPRMLLVAALAEANIEGLADYIAGADAGIVIAPKTPPAKSAIPWGGWLKDLSSEGKLAEADFDFFVFPAETPLTTLQDSEVGKILEVGAPLNEGLTKTIDDLPVDAVLINSEPERLTWHHLMLFQRCAELVTKPLLASVPPGVGSSELQALWAAGVVGVVVKTPPQGRIAELRQIIDKLVLTLPSKRRKIEPLLPRIAEEPKTAPEEE